MPSLARLCCNVLSQLVKDRLRWAGGSKLLAYKLLLNHLNQISRRDYRVKQLIFKLDLKSFFRGHSYFYHFEPHEDILFCGKL